MYKIFTEFLNDQRKAVREDTLSIAENSFSDKKYLSPKCQKSEKQSLKDCTKTSCIISIPYRKHLQSFKMTGANL